MVIVKSSNTAELGGHPAKGVTINLTIVVVLVGDPDTPETNVGCNGFEPLLIILPGPLKILQLRLW